jgi:hypothetical protein
MKVLQFFLTGGSAISFTVIAIIMLHGSFTFGLNIEYTYHLTGYLCVIYLMLQGVQFNRADVSSVKDAGYDLLLSSIPLVYLLFVFFTFDMATAMWTYVRNLMLITVVIDVFVFGWANLKMLLYTDKNARS